MCEPLLPLLVQWYGLCACLLAGLGHVRASFEWRGGIFQYVSHTESIAVQAVLVTDFTAEGAQWLLVWRGEVDVFTFIHLPDGGLRRTRPEITKKQKCSL